VACHGMGCLIPIPAITVTDPSEWPHICHLHTERRTVSRHSWAVKWGVGLGGDDFVQQRPLRRSVEEVWVDGKAVHGFFLLTNGMRNRRFADPQ
jgi:hypothetical protein